MATLIGSTTTGGSGDFFSQGDLAGSRRSAVASGSLETVSVPVDICDTFKVGVYADSAGSPGALLGQSSTAAASGSPVTRTVTFTPAISLTNGVFYWIMILPVGTGNINITLATTGGYVGRHLGAVSNCPDPYGSSDFNNGSGGAYAALGEGTLASTAGGPKYRVVQSNLRWKKYK